MNMDQRHALKFAQLAIAQQQRIMKKLAKSARICNELHNTATSQEEIFFTRQARVVLTRDARALNLYRGFLKGLAYKQIENSVRKESITPEKVLEQHLSMAQADDETLGRLFDWLVK